MSRAVDLRFVAEIAAELRDDGLEEDLRASHLKTPDELDPHLAGRAQAAIELALEADDRYGLPFDEAELEAAHEELREVTA